MPQLDTISIVTLLAAVIGGFIGAVALVLNDLRKERNTNRCLRVMLKHEISSNLDVAWNICGRLDSENKRLIDQNSGKGDTDDLVAERINYDLAEYFLGFPIDWHRHVWTNQPLAFTTALKEEELLAVNELYDYFDAIDDMRLRLDKEVSNVKSGLLEIHSEQFSINWTGIRELLKYLREYENPLLEKKDSEI